MPPHAWAIPIDDEAVPETRFLCTSVLGMRVPVCSVRSRASRADLSHRALNSWAFRLDVEPRFQVCNRTNSQVRVTVIDHRSVSSDSRVNVGDDEWFALAPRVLRFSFEDPHYAHVWQSEFIPFQRFDEVITFLFLWNDWCEDELCVGNKFVFVFCLNVKENRDIFLRIIITDRDIILLNQI